jgi:predicted peptidase
MKAITKQITPICGGFYEHLPSGYDNVKRFPLVLFLHGRGEIGSGSQTDLPSILRNGLPKFINAGFNPDFIMLAPQFKQSASVLDLDQLYTYAINNYLVDTSKVYVTGLSMGGGSTWGAASYNETLADKYAALVPICGAWKPEPYTMSVIAKLGIPVLATHNTDDPTVSVNDTIGWVDGINARSPKVPAIKTIWPSGGHNAWDRTHDPASKEFFGGNIWTWLLQFSRPQAGQPPVPNPITTPYILQIGSEKVTCYSDGTWKKTNV